MDADRSMSAPFVEELDPADCRDDAGSVSVGSLLRQLWFFEVQVFFGILEFATIAPVTQYIALSFFADRYGGGDCEASPSSLACRQAATDLALYTGYSQGLCNIFASVTGAAIGAISDRVGRRPVMRGHGWVLLFPSVAIALHLFCGMTLWVALILSPIARCYSITGILLASICDIVSKDHRSRALGVFYSWCLGITAVAVVLSGFLPSHLLVIASLVASTGKLMFLYGPYPETRPCCTSLPGTRVRIAEMCCSLFTALRMLSRNSFIIRTTLMLTFMSFALSGHFVVLGPFIIGFLGFTRSEATLLFSSFGVSAGVGLVCVGPLVKCLGEIRSLQLGLLSVIIFPLSCSVCQTKYQMIAVCTASGGLLFTMFPTISGLKSKIVVDSAQGLLQSALTSVTTLASAISVVVFSLAFRQATHGGTATSNDSVMPVFAGSACLGLLAWLLAMSLPLTLPPPVGPSDWNRVTA
eukprot:TRINITY_DN14543_c0_g1_i2.p1 TRINITY_DN14543_c0_g1~~TRINITY_DN14543_c0_g1_i2.p1  ORF type:complete len:488 (+),score=28.76 TRINITY_DN14543_c0_g1_i2:59-1465(+)